MIWFGPGMITECCACAAGATDAFAVAASPPPRKTAEGATIAATRTLRQATITIFPFSLCEKTEDVISPQLDLSWVG
jgi:hypothetical protein